MEKQFIKQIERHSDFSYGRMGNMAAGRPTLGNSAPVLMTRLMQRTMAEMLARRFGTGPARRLYYQSGRLAGQEIAFSDLPLQESPPDFWAALCEWFTCSKTANLRQEEDQKETVALQMQNGPDCGGEQTEDIAMRHFFAGLFAGIAETYFGTPYRCRFEVSPHKTAGCRYTIAPPDDGPAAAP